MSQANREKEQGSALLAMLILITFLLAVAAGLTMITSANLRSTTETDRSMRAFYVADSGAQIGNALVRSTGPTMADTSFTEPLADGSASVVITGLGGGLYGITSTGTYLDREETVELRINFISGGYRLDGSMQVSVDPGVEVTNDLPVKLGGDSVVSGKDHAPDGTLLADQTGATHGLGVNSLPGGITFQTTVAGDDSNATLEGTPSSVTNSAKSQVSFLQALYEHAKDNADVIISGGVTLGDVAAGTGLYGSATTPALVYANLGSNQTLTLNQSFSGYGTLVIRTTNSDSASALVMANYSSWQGLVLVNMNGTVNITSGSLVHLRGDAKITGGLTMLIRGGNVASVTGTGKLLHTTERSSVLYSSELVSSSKGVTELADSNVDTVSYRVQ